jgi:hypothetical protein
MPLPLPKGVLPSGGKDVPIFTVVGGYKYVKKLCALSPKGASCHPEVLRGVRPDSSEYLGMTVDCLAESHGYRDFAVSNSFKNARSHAG